jgi:hypothetical protein
VEVSVGEVDVDDCVLVVLSLDDGTHEVPGKNGDIGGCVDLELFAVAHERVLWVDEAELVGGASRGSWSSDWLMSDSLDGSLNGDGLAGDGFNFGSLWCFHSKFCLFFNWSYLFLHWNEVKHLLFFLWCIRNLDIIGINILKVFHINILQINIIFISSNLSCLLNWLSNNFWLLSADEILSENSNLALVIHACQGFGLIIVLDSDQSIVILEFILAFGSFFVHRPNLQG